MENEKCNSVPTSDTEAAAGSDGSTVVTVEGLALLEPGLSETIGATLVTALREATDAVVARGVPKEAAMDFMLGHLGIEMGILFEDFPGMFSDGAKLAIANARPKLLRDDWLNVLEPAEIEASVKEICNPKGAAS